MPQVKNPPLASFDPSFRAIFDQALKAPVTYRATDAGMKGSPAFLAEVRRFVRLRLRLNQYRHALRREDPASAEPLYAVELRINEREGTLTIGKIDSAFGDLLAKAQDQGATIPPLPADFNLEDKK